MHQVIEDTDFASCDIDEETAVALYRDLVLGRRFDERAISLQRRGWMSGYPPYRGQEASQVGAAHALREDDWLFPTYRSNALLLARGVPVADILQFRRGRPEFSSGHDLPNFPQAVPIATQIPHAAGAGMAINYCNDDRIAFCYFGDGATSEGDFHEGLNFAGVFEAPVVFFCENNGWAISLPTQRQTASATIAQKANAYGFDGVRVDGNDPIAVMETVESAIETASDGEPIMVESLTYRQGAHSTSDDPSRYRHTGGDLPEWRTADPKERYEQWLREGDVLDDDLIESIHEEVDARVSEAVEAVESSPRPEPDELFENVYGQQTPRLREQREIVTDHVEAHGHPEFEY